jgi:alpha-1,3-mannosyl-glycoprotein beta-1,2-N-acetylglucosaminyltransferase
MQPNLAKRESSRVWRRLSLRAEAKSHVKPGASGIVNDITSVPSKKGVFWSWRTLVRWTARFLLPVVLLLSSAEVVRIGDVELSIDNDTEPVRPLLLVIAHNRAQYLRRCLNSVLDYQDRKHDWFIIVSLDRQDGEQHDDVAQVVADVRQSAPLETVLLTWVHQPDDVVDLDEQYQDGLADVQAYGRISRHYKWALNRAFQEKIFGTTVDKVVVLEDDMEISADFYNYFNALAPLLDSDPTLFCISAWNDNGKKPLATDPRQLHRTDFFPGLGWMITRRFWDEISGKWPDLYWDDWLRSANQTLGRQCIRPERSRTANFGADGVSQSFNYEKHVSKVILNTDFVDFASLDLSYLSPLLYGKLVFERLSRAVLLKYSNYLTSRPQNSDVIARYMPKNIEAIGKRTGIMTDHRNGIFRTSYRGVVIIPWNGYWAFLVEKGWLPPHGYTLGSSECCDQ